MTVKPAAAVFLALLAGPPARAASPACAPGPDAPTVRLAGVDAAGDPVLEDGRTLRLVGLAPRQDEAEAARFAQGLEGWRGRDLRLVAVAAPDRWNRLPARLLAAGEGDAGGFRDIASALAEAGAARSLPEPGVAGCAPQPKAGAVAAGAGPAGTDPRTLDGHDLAALKAQAGRIVALRGRVVSVGERAQRTYLNFSHRRGEAASVAMSRSVWRAMQEKGWTAASLTGKRVLARGVLAGESGLLLEIASVAALELAD